MIKAAASYSSRAHPHGVLTSARSALGHYIRNRDVPDPDMEAVLRADPNLATLGLDRLPDYNNQMAFILHGAQNPGDLLERVSKSNLNAQLMRESKLDQAIDRMVAARKQAAIDAAALQEALDTDAPSLGDVYKMLNENINCLRDTFGKKDKNGRPIISNAQNQSVLSIPARVLLREAQGRKLSKVDAARAKLLHDAGIPKPAPFIGIPDDLRKLCESCGIHLDAKDYNSVSLEEARELVATSRNTCEG